MKDRNNKIDRLLDKNAAEHLAKVDWGRLTQETSARLARAERGKALPSGYPTFFKIAAAIAATAAVVFVAGVFKMQRHSDLEPTEGTSSDASRGTASVQIMRPRTESLVTIHIGPTERKAVKCDVKIISGSASEKGANRSTSIVITMPRPVLADNGHGRGQIDLIHLL